MHLRPVFICLPSNGIKLRDWSAITKSASKDVANVYNDPKLACNLMFLPSY